MKRREFIATLGSMMFWPLGASGQTRPLRRIGTFIVGHATSAAATERALREGLENAVGWRARQCFWSNAGSGVVTIS